jgi:N-acetylglutamate synthase-like GNAT family acetyltransferase
MGLDWHRFVLAVTQNGEVIGCGQIKPHGDGTRELASIAVIPAWRERGVARSIIEHLVTLDSGPLYLTCRAHLGPLYEKYGFHSLRMEEMPPYFRRVARLARSLGRLKVIPQDLLVMRREA